MAAPSSTTTTTMDNTSNSNPTSNPNLRRGFSMPMSNRDWSSSDTFRQLAWNIRRRNYLLRRRAGDRTITDDDLDDLRACFELGFTFDLSSELDPKLSDTFPALELYRKINLDYEKRCLSRCSSSVLSSDSESAGDPFVNPGTVFFFLVTVII